MKRPWSYLLFILWIYYLFVVCVLLFTRGFLRKQEVELGRSFCKPSTRPSIDSNCEVQKTMNHFLKTLSCFTLNEDHSSGSCGLGDFARTVVHHENEGLACSTLQFKVVLIVVDALKYDFALYDESIQVPDALPFQNKLTAIHDLLKNKPKHSKLFKFIADPPTATTQRLKSLTTGSLPTYGDFGSNFMATEISDDNILDQMIGQKKNIVFLGDDTWTKLYPNRFAREFSFPSFNAWDLDTVDSGITAHILPEINKPDWTLLIAHYLGVDHCGHRYGPFHSEMGRKLYEVNEAILNVVQAIDDKTILFVIGDHGMTATGGHGGDSQAETTAALFVYSPVPLVSTSMNNVVSQVDLVPTLSIILGLPIPFSNLGTIILDALPALEWQSLIPLVWHNIAQTTRFVQHYAKQNDLFTEEKLAAIHSNFTKLKTRVQFVNSHETFVDFVLSSKAYLIDLKDLCLEVWIRFDPFSISRGLLLFFLTIFFSYLIIDGLPGKILNPIFNGSFFIVGYGSVIFGGGCAVMCYCLELVTDFELTFYFSSGVCSIITLSVVIVQNWDAISLNFYERKKRLDHTNIAGRIIACLSLCGMFSNSYVTEEASLLSFFLLTMIWLLVYNFKHVKQTHTGKAYPTEKPTGTSFKTNLSPVKLNLFILTMIFSIMIRISRYFWRCRDEQADCDSFATSVKVDPKLPVFGMKYHNATCLFTLVCLALIATVVRIWLRCCGNLVGFSPTELMVRYGPTVVVVCTGGFWISQSLPKVTKARLFLPWQLQFLPWIVYVVVMAALLCLFLRPLCVFAVAKNAKFSYMYGEENKIPIQFDSYRNDVEGVRLIVSDKVDNGHVVYGLATCYSSVFVILSLFLFLLIALLLGDVMSPSAILMFCTGSLLLAILSVIRYEKATSIEQLFEVSWSCVICWTFLTLYFFYGTGHQSTFPGIQWDAAFVGTGGQFSNLIVPTILIGINIFCSQLLLSLSLPLLLIAPFTLRIMLPSLFSPSSSVNWKVTDLKRGELVLYQHRDLFYMGLFSLFGKYILIHGIKMFSCMLSATIHCRHMLVWKVFAPKMIFQGLELLLVIPAVIVAYLLACRITSQIDKLFINLEKLSR